MDWEEFLDPYIPVSYTHLDVYKRQDLGICLLDHLIVGKSTYYSFREETFCPLAQKREYLHGTSDGTIYEQRKLF